LDTGDLESEESALACALEGGVKINVLFSNVINQQLASSELFNLLFQIINL
jgi:hypothetical protein